MSKTISLISELVTIDHGKYIVKVSANHEGIVLGTGLAAADSIEVAEDRARERALGIVDFTVSPTEAKPVSQPKKLSISSPPQPQVNSSFSIDTVETFNSVKIEKPINSPQSTPISQSQAKIVEPVTQEHSNVFQRKNHQENPEELTTKSNLTTTPESKPELPLNSSPTLERKISQSSSEETNKQEYFTSDLANFHSSRENQETEEQPTLPIEFPPETPKIETQTENKTLAQPQQVEDKSEKEEQNQQQDFKSNNNVFSFPTSNSVDEVEKNNPEPSSYNLEETMDFAQIINETTIEMKRLNWTQEQGRTHLLQTYGKKSRHLLSDEELIEFLNYLKTQ